MSWPFPVPDGNLAPALWPDILVMASTILAEAGGEGHAGQLAVGSVIMERAVDKRWPDTPGEVCLQRAQFSCWSDEKLRLHMLWPKKYATEDQWTSCFRAAIEAYFSLKPAFTGGANHYLNTETCEKAGGLPSWFDKSKVTATFGRHTFLRL